jgi:predicted phage-related endonuclease
VLSEWEEGYRRGKFTGSLAPKVMTLTDPAELNRLARIKAGLEPPDPETYQMRAGTHMEPFIKRELELLCGHPITRCGEIVDHPTIPDVCCKLDGYRAFDDTVIEFKFLSAWSKRDEYFPFYYWQVLLQVLCTGASRGALVVAQGTSPPVEHEVMYDKACADALIERAMAFMLCVKTNTPPCPLPAPVPPDRMRAIDITKTETNWGDELLAYLTQYSATKKFAEVHDEAGKAARALIPDDVNKVIAGRWQLARDKRGAIRITHKDAKEAA